MRDPHDSYWQTWSRYARVIMVWSVVTILVGVFSASAAFAIGGFCGGLVAWFNFRLLAQDVSRAVEMAPDKAQRFAASRYMLRYFATGAVLVALVTQEKLGLPAFIAALFPLLSVKLTLYVETGINVVRQWLESRGE